MTADEEGWIEGMSEFYISIDDGWSRIFVMILGTALPDNKVKEQFVVLLKFSTLTGLSCKLTTATLPALEPYKSSRLAQVFGKTIFKSSL